jgi:hypothetical protein
MSEYGERIEDLVARVRADREAFEPPSEPPDEGAAVDHLRCGAGEAVAVYVDARTGELYRFDPEEFDRLEWALNESLSLYAACYGVDAEFDRNLREAAELLVDTHSIHETAQALTHVPPREEFSVGRE